MRKYTLKERKEIRDAFPSEEAEYIIKNVDIGSEERKLDKKSH